MTTPPAQPNPQAAAAGIAAGAAAAAAFDPFGAAIMKLEQASIAAIGGPSGQFKLDPDAVQRCIGTWDDVIDELDGCKTDAEPMTRIKGPTDHDQTTAVGPDFNQAGNAYLDHINQLTDTARKEQQKLQAALKAYQQNDSGGADAARGIHRGI